MGVSLYEEFTILGCAVEGNSSSHHGSRHGADHDLMYGPRPILKWKNGEMEKWEPTRVPIFMSRKKTGLQSAGDADLGLEGVGMYRVVVFVEGAAREVGA